MHEFKSCPDCGHPMMFVRPKPICRYVPSHCDETGGEDPYETVLAGDIGWCCTVCDRDETNFVD